MRMLRPHRHNGFTMIELIVAIALAVVMIAAVYTATSSMADSARRQQAVASRDARWNSVAEILRRDLRGWLQSKQTSPAPSSPASPEQTILLQLSTTADGIAGEIVNGATTTRQRATIGVEYMVRKVLSRYELVRTEPSVTQETELVLLISEAPPKLEFYNGKAWIEKWTSGDRPLAVRFTTENAKNLIVRL